MKKTLLLPLLCVAALFTGCINSIIAVNGRLADSSPDITAFHAVFASYALDVLSLGTVATNSSGEFSVDYGYGEVFSGKVEFQTGVFNATLTLPGQYNDEIDFFGRLTLAPGGLISAARYVETYKYSDGTSQAWNAHFEATPTTLNLDAVSDPQGVQVTSITQLSNTDFNFVETWSLPSVFVEHVTTDDLFVGAGATVQQNWTRDDLAVDVQPDDLASNYIVYPDGSGSGSETFYYAHGISQTYTFVQDSNFNVVEKVTYVDPAVPVGTAGTGTFTETAQGVGGGTYTQTFLDGSVLDLSEQFLSNKTAEAYTFDDASVAWKPALTGTVIYLVGGGGNGSWEVFGPGNVVEQSCTYNFDDSGNVSSLLCTPDSAPTAAAPLGSLPSLHVRPSSRVGPTASWRTRSWARSPRPGRSPGPRWRSAGRPTSPPAT